MLYVKAILVGVGTAVGGFVLLVAVLAVGMWLVVWKSMSGSPGIGAVELPIPIALVLLIGFVAGFAWTLWRR